MRKALLLGILLCAACAPVGIPPVSSAELHPYQTMTPSATADPAGVVIQSSASTLPSATPFTYAVKSGDTMGQIAEKFNVSLDALLAANPDVDPNGMRIGQALQIPSNPRNITGQATPTPVPLAVEQVGCHPAADRGLWCFALVRNDLPDPVEDVTAQVTLLDSKGAEAASQTALLLLDVLAPGEALPLSVSFAPGLPADVHPQVQLLTAIRLLPNDPRYLDATVRNTQVEVDGSGLSAQASGQVHLSADSKPCTRLWIAAVVYDDAGNVTGVRRWEATATLQPGADLPFSFDVASLAGEIARVDFAVEARP